MDNDSIFIPLLSPSLTNHLQVSAPTPIAITPLSRLPPSRLITTALPHISVIELVTSTTFPLYHSLYTASFPKRTERERSSLITTRLLEQSTTNRPGFAPYRLIGIRGPTGTGIAAAHISILPLEIPGSESKFTVPYLQYIYVHPNNRRQDLSEVLHAFILAVATADAATQGRSVPFTLFETEPPGHGDDEESRLFSVSRAQVHAKSGALALMLRDPDPNPTSNSVPTSSSRSTKPKPKFISPHVQPGLDPADPPLSLLWCIRPSPAPGQPYDVKQLGRGLIAAYYQSLRDEGFPEANIALAERMVGERCEGREFCLVPLSETAEHVG